MELNQLSSRMIKAAISVHIVMLKDGITRIINEPLQAAD